MKIDNESLDALVLAVCDAVKKVMTDFAPSRGRNLEEAYLTPQEAADVLKLHVESVYRMIRSDKLHAVKWGRSWRVPGSAIKEAEVQQRNGDKEVNRKVAEILCRRKDM
jgi:excisionase family DNA binding protein